MDAPAPSTLEALAARYDTKIRLFLQKVTVLSPEDLDDTVQDVYARFAKYGLLDRYRRDASAFTTYLYLVCQSVARNKHRAAQRRPKPRPMHPAELGFTDAVAQRRSRVARQLQSRAMQEEQLIWSEVLDTLRQRPELATIVARFEKTGKVTPADRRCVREAVRPLLSCAT